MSTLRRLAEVLASHNRPDDKRPNVDGVAKIIVLVAYEVAQIPNTGNTYDQIERDACTVLHALLDGVQL